MKSLYNIGDEVYYIHDDTLTIQKFSIQGIQKEDSHYFDEPYYEYSLEDMAYQKDLRNTDGYFIRCKGSDIFASKDEAIKRLNCIKKERKRELIRKMRML